MGLGPSPLPNWEVSASANRGAMGDEDIGDEVEEGGTSSGHESMAEDASWNTVLVVVSRCKLIVILGDFFETFLPWVFSGSMSISDEDPLLFFISSSSSSSSSRMFGK